MLTSLMLVAALSLAPAQSGELELTNIRPTYGLMGPSRPDDKVLPGDIYFVSYDIENIHTDSNGEVQYSMGMEMLDGKMKTQYKSEPKDLKTLNSLGGNRLPAFAHVDVGLDVAPGEYKLRVTVTDNSNKKTKSFERSFEVLEPSFGITRLNLSGDPQGYVSVPPLGVAGETIWTHFAVVGFKRGGDKKEPNIAVEMQIVDENGNPTLAKPFSGTVTEVPKEFKHVPWDFLVSLNRLGRFTVKVKATDKINNKTAELSFPIRVVDLESK